MKVFVLIFYFSAGIIVDGGMTKIPNVQMMVHKSKSDCMAHLKILKELHKEDDGACIEGWN